MSSAMRRVVRRTPLFLTLVGIMAAFASVVAPASASATTSTVPSAPTAVTGIAGDTTVNVSWQPPASNGGTAITSYTVTSAPGAQTATSTSTSATIHGLTDGTAYTFTVKATNRIGTGAASAASAKVTPSAPLSAPQSVTAVAGDGQASVSWAAPACTGGSPITGYTVTSSPGLITATTTGARSVTVLGLTDGTAYTFTVVAHTALATSPPSAPSASVTPVGKFTPPTGVAVTGVGDSEVDLQWTPGLGGGLPITSYVVTSKPGNLSETSTAGPTIAFTGLTNGVTYTFTVVGVNALGRSAASAPSAPATPATAPGAATNVVAVAGNQQATITWKAPASDGGSAITSYTIDNSQNATAVVVGPTVRSATVTGLINGTQYQFLVVPSNARGATLGVYSNAVTPWGAPVQVAGLVVTGVSDGEIDLEWDGPINTAPVTKYTITSSAGQHYTSLIPDLNVTGLTDGVSYTFTVVATNAVGSAAPSAPSAPATPHAPYTAPSPSTNVIAVAGDGTATVTWTPPTSDGGSPITSYTVDAQTDDLSVTVPATATSATFTGLTDGTQYEFIVVASSNYAASVSAYSNFVTPWGAPVQVAGLVVVGISDGEIDLEWDGPIDTAPVTTYTITSSSGQTYVSLIPDLNVTGLTDGVSYTFTVVATNSVGSAAPSAPSAPATPVTVSGPATAVTATAGASQATVTWIAPTFDGGSPVTSYEVFDTTDNTEITVPGTGPLSVTFTGLASGQSYTFYVILSTAQGSVTSAPSNTVTAQ